MMGLEQAAEAGRKAARATHYSHDAALAQRMIEYQSRYVSAQPQENRKALVEAFSVAYRDEASNYMGK